MKKYRVLGIPLGGHPVMTYRAPGEEFEAKLAKDDEDFLVSSGALEVVAQTKKDPPAAKKEATK